MTEKRITPGKVIDTGNKISTWHCGTCGYQGSTGTWKAHDGEEGHWCYKCREKGVKSPLTTLLIEEKRWEPGLTEVRCCGQWLPCTRFTNTCRSCESDYNSSGQLLAPRSQWGEETGETAADILGL